MLRNKRGLTCKGFTQHHFLTKSGERGLPSTIFRKNGAGFTILEAMIAVVILSVALLALLRVMPVGIKGSKLAEETTIATMLAQRKIEETRAGTFPTAGTTTGNFTTEGYPNFEYIQNISNVTPTTYLREVTVSIYWPAGKPTAEQRVVGFTTQVAKYE